MTRKRELKPDLPETASPDQVEQAGLDSFPASDPLHGFPSISANRPHPKRKAPLQSPLPGKPIRAPTPRRPVTPPSSSPCPIPTGPAAFVAARHGNR